MVFDAPVDSGTSFTALEDPIYKYIAKSFNAQAQVKRYKTDPDSTFKYCFELSLNQTSILLPEINLTTHGGSVFPTNQSIYCLAIVKISGISILRQNFLMGLHVVFDRERLILGWKNSDCYAADNSTGSSPPLAPAPSPSGCTRETEARGSTAQVPVGLSS
ncbi:aspartyl protease family protein 1-like [Musa acuminata AAA Group]|uniref:aspartyl protease family protein 1-like n=1 Tax=Musa acuminata AAA Group TaxID=214697 RepID=UPI0031D5D73F